MDNNEGGRKRALIDAVNPGGRRRSPLPPAVWGLAGRHRLQPLVAYHLTRGGRRRWDRLLPRPEEVRRRTLARNLSILAAQERLLRRLDREGIESVVIKGVGLCDLAYPDLGCRPTGDIDLLVRREHVHRALEVLGGVGYRSLRPLPPLDRFHEANLVRPDEGSRVPPVDLHWGLCAERFGLHARFDFDLTEDDVWRNADLERHRLGSGMTFLHLMLHAFTNAFSSLSDFVDVLYAYRAVERRVDWIEWVEGVRRFRMGRVVSFALSRVAEWWGIRLPEPLARLVGGHHGLGFHLPFIRDAAWRGDIGGWRERLAMPLFFEPAVRIPRSYLRMVFGLVDSRP